MRSAIVPREIQILNYVNAELSRMATATHRDRRPVRSFFIIDFKYFALSLPLHRVTCVQLFFTRKGDETSSFHSYYRILNANKMTTNFSLSKLHT